MNINDLQERLAKLTAEQQTVQQQSIANIGAYNGAIQECQYWIGLLGAKVPVVATETPVPEDNVSIQ